LGTLVSSANFNNPNRVHVSGTTAYLASSTNDAVVLVDVTNDASMTYLKRLRHPALDRIYDIDVAEIDGDTWVFAVARDADFFSSLRLS
jgi:hypothetical protein